MTLEEYHEFVSRYVSDKIDERIKDTNEVVVSLDAMATAYMPYPDNTGVKSMSLYRLGTRIDSEAFKGVNMTYVTFAVNLLPEMCEFTEAQKIGQFKEMALTDTDAMQSFNSLVQSTLNKYEIEGNK